MVYDKNKRKAVNRMLLRLEAVVQRCLLKTNKKETLA